MAEPTVSDVLKKVDDTIDAVQDAQATVVGFTERLATHNINPDAHCGALKNLMHLTGNETVAGTKTFTSNPMVSKANPEYQAKHTGIARGTAPASDTYTHAIRLYDKNGKTLGGVEHGLKTSLENRMNLIVYNGKDAAATGNAQISVGFNSAGSWFTYAPTPAAGDNSTKIATTAFVKSALPTWVSVVTKAPTTPPANCPNGALFIVP